MKTILFVLLPVIFLCTIVSQGLTFEYHWEIDETPEGQETVTPTKPVVVTLLDTPIEVPPHTAALHLMKRYSVFLDTSWTASDAQKLFLTFQSIPQILNSYYDSTPYEERQIEPSTWKISDLHLHNDINIEYQNGIKIINVARGAFVYANPLMAKIEGIRGKYFSKRLHRAVVRYVTDNGADRAAIDRILHERYAVSVNVPDYTELTRYTTGEHAGRFEPFKNEELIKIISMLEEFPSGMHKTPGLKYLVRRLDGTVNPRYPLAAALAWTGQGYIEFMEIAFVGSTDSIHRIILHEKAHFLWEFLFDDQLKQDWIEVGGWYENPDDIDDWSTTKQTEFVSAYAHGINPNEDMAESISFYIVQPDVLRARSPDKYEFIQNRIMHGTRYISQIREDLAFQVYNLYPDYVYPGRIIRVDAEVTGAPEEDKQITITIELHHENDLDLVNRGWINMFNEKDILIGMFLSPIDSEGRYVSAGYILQGKITLSKYAASGYVVPDAIGFHDDIGNSRFSGNEFGLKLYIDNPLADCEPPEYVPNSLRLSLSDAETDQKEHYQILTVQFKIIEKNGLHEFLVSVDNENPEKYTGNYGWSNSNGYNSVTGEAVVNIIFPDYSDSGIYAVHQIKMKDLAGNSRGVYFVQKPPDPSGVNIIADELSPTVEIVTPTPDTTPPVLDIDNITIKAEPINPEAPNGETRVDITFRVKDDISGFGGASMALRDPHGTFHWYGHPGNPGSIYFIGDPTVFTDYHTTIVLPIGSVPGTWGLAEMNVNDKAQNTSRYDFTEIVRFEVDDGTVYAKSDVNEDGEINILDLVIVAAFDVSNERADVNGDGTVNILDLVTVASNLGEGDVAAPAVHSPTADQIQSWITQAMQADDGSPAFRRGIRALQNLLLKLRPETTALLPNYPNPFNPETWIPYHLANASDVQITIYDMRGSIVRTLMLGHRTAGYYTDKNRAAYWDGRNNVGERAASGVYFYQLQADAISQLRKMIILK